MGSPTPLAIFLRYCAVQLSLVTFEGACSGWMDSSANMTTYKMAWKSFVSKSKKILTCIDLYYHIYKNIKKRLFTQHFLHWADVSSWRKKTNCVNFDNYCDIRNIANVAVGNQMHKCLPPINHPTQQQQQYHQQQQWPYTKKQNSARPMQSVKSVAPAAGMMFGVARRVMWRVERRRQRRRADARTDGRFAHTFSHNIKHKRWGSGTNTHIRRVIYTRIGIKHWAQLARLFYVDNERRGAVLRSV